MTSSRQVVAGSLVLIALLLACSPATRVTRLSPEPLPPRPADHPIRFYRTATPRCPYEEVGIVTSRKRNTFVSMDEVVEAMRVKARELGGDAVVGVGESERVGTTTASPVGHGAVLTTDRDPELSGTVVRFRDLQCTE